VRRTLVDAERRALDHLCRARATDVQRHDLIVLAVDDERRTSIFSRSRLKSVAEKALMQSCAAGIPACMQRRQNASRTPCETVEPGRFAP
jgi:hypothetical protein